MKRAGNIQKHRSFDPAFLADFDCIPDFSRFAGKDDLTRRIQISNVYIRQTRHFEYFALFSSDECGHRAGRAIARLLHVLCTPSNKAKPGCEIKCLSGRVCGEFAQRQPGCGREYPVRRYRYNTLRLIGWPLYRVARFTSWCGHGQELIPVPDGGEWVRCIPVVGTAK